MKSQSSGWLLVAILAAASVSAHWAPGEIAHWFEDPIRAEQEIYYVLRGVETLILWITVAYLGTIGDKRTWRPYALAIVCAYGAFASALSATCGLAYAQLDKALKTYLDASAGLCNVVDGWDNYVLGVCIFTLILIALWRLGDED